MRKLILPAAALAVCWMTSASWASIGGSAHDFAKPGYTWSKGQICQPCHAPHNTIVKDANQKALAGPLWNHTLSTATYTLYLDDSGNAVTGEVDQNSKLCLSCHDGTVALDSFGGSDTTKGAGTAGALSGDANLGTDLSNDHPIGENAIWPTPNPSYMVDPAIRAAPTYTSDGSGQKKSGIMPLRPMADGRLAVGCTTCHEPHNRTGNSPLLWAPVMGQYTTVDGRTVNGSGLCLNCHKK